MIFVELDKMRVSKETSVLQKDDVVEVSFVLGKEDIPNLHPKTLSLCMDTINGKLTFYSRKVVKSNIKYLYSSVDEIESVTLAIELGEHIII